MMICWNVGAMLGCWCNVSAFDLNEVGLLLKESQEKGCMRRSMCRPSKIGVLIFEDQRSIC